MTWPKWYRRPWLPFWRIDLLEGVDRGSEQYRNSVEAARVSREESEQPILPAFPYTEGNPRWTMLYDHIRLGQIRPEALKRMRRADLEFIAAHPNPELPNPGYLNAADWDLVRGRHGKLLGNITRAAREIQRRDTLHSTLYIATTGALFGGLAVALIPAFS